MNKITQDCDLSTRERPISTDKTNKNTKRVKVAKIKMMKKFYPRKKNILKAYVLIIWTNFMRKENVLSQHVHSSLYINFKKSSVHHFVH